MMPQNIDDAIKRLPTDTAEKLRQELVRVQIEGLKLGQDSLRQRLEQRIDEHAQDIKDHEQRLRAVEDSVAKFNTILWLTMGGGLVGVLNLILLSYTLLNMLR